MIEYAKVAAYSLMGRSEEYAGIPWFWSNQGDLKLQIAGLSNCYDYTVVRHDTEGGKFSVLYYRDGHPHQRGDQVFIARARALTAMAEYIEGSYNRQRCETVH